MKPGDSINQEQVSLLKLFEGAWLSSPSGKRCYAKVMNGRLLIPYSNSEVNKLAGHYFNCRVIGNKLLARHERFDPYVGGALLLKLGENRTLKGGWWPDKDLPKPVLADIGQLDETIPGMHRCVWVLMPKAKIPVWVKEYFLKDSAD